MWINIGTEECHVTSCLEGAGRDVATVEFHGVAHDGHHRAEGGGDVFEQDAALVLGIVIVWQGEP